MPLAVYPFELDELLRLELSLGELIIRRQIIDVGGGENAKNREHSYYQGGMNI